MAIVRETIANHFEQLADAWKKKASSGDLSSDPNWASSIQQLSKTSGDLVIYAFQNGFLRTVPHLARKVDHYLTKVKSWKNGEWTEQDSKPEYQEDLFVELVGGRDCFRQAGRTGITLRGKDGTWTENDGLLPMFYPEAFAAHRFLGPSGNDEASQWCNRSAFACYLFAELAGAAHRIALTSNEDNRDETTQSSLVGDDPQPSDRQQQQADEEPPPEAGPKHSSDFRSVNWFGIAYTFTASQAACVKLLWEAWEAGTPDCGDQSILETIESTAERLAHVFRVKQDGKTSPHPAWGTMITQGSTKGTHRLSGLM